MHSETVILEGDIIDSGSLSKVLDEILAGGASYEIFALQIGIKQQDPSFARIKVTAASEAELGELLSRLQKHAARPETVEDARFEVADAEGAFPAGFYSSTNLDTELRVEAKWVPVDRPEMDCGVVLDGGRARTIAMSDVRPGMNILMAGPGIRVTQLDRAKAEDGDGFGFMSSDVSSEKPKALLVDQVAEQMRLVKESGRRILWVAGPAIVHTGSAPDVSALVRAGYVNALFAGNGVAAHDIESHVYGTSLGVYLDRGIAADHGHEHHIRAINEVRRHGSFEAAIEAGLFADGLVYNLVQAKSDYLFGGSVRDDGPLPEVVTDVLEVQRRLRDIIWGTSPHGDGELIGFCIVVGTMLHGIATGNCLPASVPLVCVDINQSTVTKLMDRGSFQSVGIITDVGLFIRELAEKLAPEELRRAGDVEAQRIAGSRTQL